VESGLRKVKQLPDCEGIQSQAMKTAPVVKKLPSPLQLQRAAVFSFTHVIRRLPSLLLDLRFAIRISPATS